MDNKLSSQNDPKNPYLKKVKLRVQDLLNTILDVLKGIHCVVEHF